MKKMELYGSLHIPLYLFTLEIKETIYSLFRICYMASTLE